MFSVKRSLVLISVMTLLASCSGSQSLSESIKPEIKENTIVVSPSEAVSYDSYGDLLSKYVSDTGLVDYDALKSNRQLLDKFNNSVGSVKAATFLSWSENEQIAFLMNAYNSYTLAAIIDRESIPESIRDIPRVWKKQQYRVVGQNRSLDNIEHDTLREDYNEPRLHAALVCAAISCPPLRNEPYRGETLDTQLENQVTTWFSDRKRGLNIDRQNNTVSISSIFKWYGEDWILDYETDTGFTGSKKEKAVLNFISNYVSPEDARYLKEGNYKVKYLDYDWSLNARSTS